MSFVGCNLHITYDILSVPWATVTLVCRQQEKWNKKTVVINDPPGQPLSLTSSDFCLM